MTLATAQRHVPRLFVLAAAATLVAPSIVRAAVVYWDDTVAANYGTCRDLQSGELTIDSAVDPNFDTPPTNIGGVVPGSCYRLTGNFITNNTEFTVTVTAEDVYDTGTIAPFINQYFGQNWLDRTAANPLAPGESTALFDLYVGMPLDTGNEAQGTTGTFGWQWLVQAVLPPPAAEADSASTDFETPVVIDVLANDTAVDPTATVAVTGDDADQGMWTVEGDRTVTFTPAAGFSGDATATYIVTNPDTQTATATITVTVAQPPPTTTTTTTTTPTTSPPMPTTVPPPPTVPAPPTAPVPSTEPPQPPAELPATGTDGSTTALGTAAAAAILLGTGLVLLTTLRRRP